MSDILILGIFLMTLVNTVRNWKPKACSRTPSWMGSSPTNYFEINTNDDDYKGGTSIPPCQSRGDD